MASRQPRQSREPSGHRPALRSLIGCWLALALAAGAPALCVLHCQIVPAGDPHAGHRHHAAAPTGAGPCAGLSAPAAHMPEALYPATLAPAVPWLALAANPAGRETPQRLRAAPGAAPPLPPPKTASSA